MFVYNKQFDRNHLKTITQIDVQNFIKVVLEKSRALAFCKSFAKLFFGNVYLEKIGYADFQDFEGSQ